MSYNTDGPSFGGFSPMPFPIFSGGGNSNNDNFGGPFGWLMALLFFSLFGFGGGMMPGRGMPMPFGGMMPCGGAAAAASGNIAAETAAYINAQNTADRVASIGTGVDAVAGIVTANGVKIETVKDQNAAGFANLNTHMCEGFHSVSQQFNAQTMQGMNLHNATTALLNDIRAEAARCCCESKTLAQAIASQQQYQSETNKSEIMRAIEALGCRIEGRIDGLERAALQDKLAAANERNAELKAKLDNQNQTAELLAAIQRAACPAPAPVPYPYGYTPCNPCTPCSPCAQLSEAIIQKGINGIVNPTTTAAA